MVVAQLVEPQIVVLVVVGSIPIDHPKYPSSFDGFFYGICFVLLTLGVHAVYIFLDDPDLTGNCAARESSEVFIGDCRIV